MSPEAGTKIDHSPTPVPTLPGLGEVWRGLPDRAFLIVLLLAWTALFHFWGNSTLGYVNTPSLFGWWTWVQTRGASDAEGFHLGRLLDHEEAHAWFIPVVVLALLWQRRDELLALPKRAWWPALLVLGLAILLHVAGYMIQQARVSVVAYFLGVYALTGLVWGGAWSAAVLVPFALFVFCVPLGSAVEPITFPLRLMAAKLTGAFSETILGINVLQRGTELFDASGAYRYEVAAACSGIRSLTAIAAFGVIYGYISFRSPWRRLWIAASAIPLAVVANVFRLVLIIIAAEAFGQKAGNAVHESTWFSLAPYVPAFAGMLLLGRWLREDRPAATPPESLSLAGMQEKV